MTNHNFRVPQRYVPGFRRIARLGPGQMESLFGVLSGLGATWGHSAVVSAVVARMEKIDEEQAEDIVSAVMALYLIQSKFDWSTDWLVSQIVLALQDSEAVPEISADPQEFGRRLRRLLSLDHTLGVTAKAIDLALEHEHMYCQARILTDIRPIFSRDVSELPAGAVIVHSLRLRYHIAAEVREFFVAMTPEELERMRRVLDRATDKTATLRALLDSAGIPELSTEEDGDDGRRDSDG